MNLSGSISRNLARGPCEHFEASLEVFQVVVAEVPIEVADDHVVQVELLWHRRVEAMLQGGEVGSEPSTGTRATCFTGHG